MLLDELYRSVRDAMKTAVAEALRMMKHIETQCLIANKRHADDERGIALISDIARQVLAKDRAPERVNVCEILSGPVIAVDPLMDIRYRARLLQKFGLSRAPVIEQGRIVGIVSYTDIWVCSMNGGGPVNRNPPNPPLTKKGSASAAGGFFSVSTTTRTGFL